MIHSSTFTFLEGIRENNDRNWFLLNKERYEEARENILEFTASVITGLASVDTTVPADLDPKNCLMRIYRDVRFSKNKSPYKTNFGIAISARGKNFDGPGYYLHIEPGQSFVAAGSWMPSPEHLKSIRQEIDYNGSELLEAIGSSEFKAAFGDLSTEEQLKTAPKGYPADHPMISYLKMKSFTASTKIDDEVVMASDAVAHIVGRFGTLFPLVSFLRNAIA